MTKKTQAELKRLRKEAATIHDRISEIEIADRIEQAKRMIGKCFKVRNNFSCPSKPSDYWWLYLVVTGHDDGGWLKLVKFQIDKNDRLEVTKDEIMMPHSIAGYVEISTNEFLSAWEQVENHRNKIGRLLVSAI